VGSGLNPRPKKKDPIPVGSVMKQDRNRVNTNVFVE
jgi:hypothetical protein